MEGDDLHRLAQAHVVGQAAAEAELAHARQPGQAPQLVGAQFGHQGQGRGQGHQGARRQPAQAFGHIGHRPFGDDVDELAVDLELARQQGAERRRRRHPPAAALLGLGDEGGVHGHETAPDAHQAPLGLGQQVDLLGAERLAIDGELVVEVEQPAEVEAAFGHRRRRRRQDGPQAEPAPQQLAGPQDGDAGPAQLVGPVEQQVGEQVVVEGQGVGDALVQEGAYRLPGPRTAPQGQEHVPLGLFAEAGQQRRRHGEQVGGVDHQARVGEAGDLQHAFGLGIDGVTELDAQGEAGPAVEATGRLGQPGP